MEKILGFIILLLVLPLMMGIVAFFSMRDFWGGFKLGLEMTLVGSILIISVITAVYLISK